MDNKLSELSKPVALNGWRVTVTRTGDRQGVASISGPGVFCMEVPVEYSMLDFMEALSVPPAPVSAQAVAWEMRYWNSGHNCWHDWERITAEQHAEMSVQHAADNDYEFRVLYDSPPAPAVPDESDPRDAFESVFPMPKYVVRCGTGYAVTAYSAWGAHDFKERWEGWNACRAAMLENIDKPAPQLDSVVTRHADQPVSSGYKLVPAEPTEDMIAAAMNCDDVSSNADETFCVNFGNIYAAMLAAAPEGGNGA